MRTWFITGTSTGFGKLLTLDLLAAGERVVATARKVHDLAVLTAVAGDVGNRLITLPLDVTDDTRVKAAIHEAIGMTAGIDVLVNNAGYGYMAPQEEGNLDEIRAMFDVNVFGLIAVTQAMLPHFRERGAGMIVNLSSIGGRAATPRGGFYQSTKWAVECLSQAVFLEGSRYGLKVRVIEPGAYDTDFGTRSIRVHPAVADGTSAYQPWFHEWLEASSHIFKYGRQDPLEVVRALRESVDRPDGFLRVPVGRDTADYLAIRDNQSDEEYFATMRSYGYGLSPEQPFPHGE
ncbi:MAG: SDR family oxidoreductase [bacterium]